MRREQFTGCLLGLAMGDALGAPYEGGLAERLVWRVIGRTRDGCLRWTDDTQMALDLAESLVENDGLRQDALALRFASGYRWSRGYGRGAAEVLKRIRRGQHWSAASKAAYPEGSYGNGAAMRAPVLALFFARDPEGLLEAARLSAVVTHSHPAAIDGASLMAAAAHGMLHGHGAARVIAACAAACATADMLDRIERVAAWEASGTAHAPREVAKMLGNGMTAATSCPTALHVALRHLHEPFPDMMRFILECKGDVDTIGAMAGALWGIANGSANLPAVKLEARARLEEVAERLYRRAAPA